MREPTRPSRLELGDLTGPELGMAKNQHSDEEEAMFREKVFQAAVRNQAFTCEGEKPHLKHWRHGPSGPGSSATSGWSDRYQCTGIALQRS